jgi:hypothetical protein
MVRANGGAGPFVVTFALTTMSAYSRWLARLSSSVMASPAPDIMLAEPYKGEDPTGYWVSEKLDGVRCTVLFLDF